MRLLDLFKKKCRGSPQNEKQALSPSAARSRALLALMNSTVTSNEPIGMWDIARFLHTNESADYPLNHIAGQV